MAQSILVIEGDQTVRLAMRALLVEALPDVVVLTSEDAKDALTLAHQKHPNLVLVSSQLAGGTGADVVEALRTLPNMARVPVVGVGSANWQATISAEMMALCDDCLPANYQSSHLVAAIRQYLPGRNAAFC